MKWIIVILAMVALSMPVLSCTANAAVKADTAEIGSITWTKDAQDYFDEHVPEMMRDTAKETVEEKAREKDKNLITLELLLEIKKEMGR